MALNNLITFLPGLGILLGLGGLLALLWACSWISPAMRKTRLRLPIIGCLYGFALLIYAVLAPGFLDGTTLQSSARTAEVLHKSGLALLSYASDNDEELPPASRWATAASGYSTDSLNLLTATLPPPVNVDSRYAFAANPAAFPRTNPDQTRPAAVLVEYLASSLNALATNSEAVPRVRHGGHCAVFLEDGAAHVYARSYVSRLVRESIR